MIQILNIQMFKLSETAVVSLDYITMPLTPKT